MTFRPSMRASICATSNIRICTFRGSSATLAMAFLALARQRARRDRPCLGRRGGNPRIAIDAASVDPPAFGKRGSTARRPRARLRHGTALAARDNVTRASSPRRVAAVTDGARRIGDALGARLLADGAAVVSLDMTAPSAPRRVSAAVCGLVDSEPTRYGRHSGACRPTADFWLSGPFRQDKPARCLSGKRTRAEGQVSVARSLI